jgi:NtrC-family two-component system sensor histidine kinase KinB
MIGIRQKLLLGFGSILIIVAGIGAVTILQLRTLGRAIDVILRENYRSVVACQQMKEALERIDSGVLFTLAGNQSAGQTLVEENLRTFEAAYEVEMGNVTLPGEGERAQRVGALFADFGKQLPLVIDATRPMGERQSAYFTSLFPLFNSIKGTAQSILDMNQANMSAANDTARREAAAAGLRLSMAILACLAITLLFMLLAQKWIATPLKRLTASAQDIRNGNLDLVLETSSSDEIGRLSEAFNTMAQALRLARRTEQLKLMRSRHATEEVFKALPAAIAILDPEGRVETATETAHKYFGLVPGARVRDLGFDWLTPLVDRAFGEGRTAEPGTPRGYIQQFIAGQEYFFQPSVHPIPAEGEKGGSAGAAVIFKDVTEVRERQELKRGVVATVAHQLRTPLTSLRMSLHLLLGDSIGPLNEKQAELALAAREESERLTSILNDLLDTDRLPGGKEYLRLQPSAPHALADKGIEPFLAQAKVKGTMIVNAVPEDLPMVQADPDRIGHVFSNLLSNALRFLEPGGVVGVRGSSDDKEVKFELEDTGSGIPPEYLSRVFEPFFRVPGQDPSTGAGLGLSIVKEIVETHGGTVGAMAAPSRGAIFWFTLPRADRSLMDGQTL